MSDERIDQLTDALALAQQEFKPVLKTSWNPNLSSHFADLATIIEATQPALSKHGLVVMQTAQADHDKKTVTITTTLAHRSGQSKTSELTMPATMVGKNEWVNGQKVAGERKFDPQSIGAAITYGRRYSYQAMIGVVGEPDEDGEDGEVAGTTQEQQAVVDRKLAGKGKPANAPQESVTFIPGADGMTYLSGLKGIPILRSNAPEKAKVLMVWMDHHAPPMWAIPDDQVDNFKTLCAKLKVAVIVPERKTEAANG